MQISNLSRFLNPIITSSYVMTEKLVFFFFLILYPVTLVAIPVGFRLQMW